MFRDNREVLHQRAIKMAHKEAELNADIVTEAISFTLAGETYAIASSFVREVFHMKDFTTIPGVPPYIFSLINVRGQILPVVDMKVFFNLPSKGFGEFNKVIILSSPNMEFGILADVVIGTILISDEEILQVPHTITGIAQKYLSGVTRENLIFLNGEALLTGEGLIIDDK